MPHQSSGDHGGGSKVVAIGLQGIWKHRKRQAQQEPRDCERRARARPNGSTRIIGCPVYQDSDRVEQPHEIILPCQRRGHRHQTKQDTEFFGIRARRGPRVRRHHRDVSEPDGKRDGQHDPVRRLVIEIEQIHVGRRLVRVILVVVDRPRQPMRDRDDGLIDPGPVLLAALSKPLLRTGSHHALKPGLQFGNVVLEAAHGRRNDKQ